MAQAIMQLHGKSVTVEVDDHGWYQCPLCPERHRTVTTMERPKFRPDWRVVAGFEPDTWAEDREARDAARTWAPDHTWDSAA